MMSREQAEEILRVLNSLPAEKVEEVKDFALFLKAHYGQRVDESTQWSDEDLRDWTSAALNYADENL
jgi:hypothetical protein